MNFLDPPMGMAYKDNQNENLLPPQAVFSLCYPTDSLIVNTMYS